MRSETWKRMILFIQTKLSSKLKEHLKRIDIRREQRKREEER